MQKPDFVGQWFTGSELDTAGYGTFLMYVGARIRKEENTEFIAGTITDGFGEATFAGVEFDNKLIFVKKYNKGVSELAAPDNVWYKSSSVLDYYLGEYKVMKGTTFGIPNNRVKPFCMFKLKKN